MSVARRSHPGCIDSHVHPAAGDFTPRHNALGWIESAVHGGVTTLISAGEPHFPGRPRDAVGAKALAILAHRSFATLRPGGGRVEAGAVLLEPGLTDGDFAEMAAAGVRRVGEIGISSAQDLDVVLPLVEMARRHDFLITVHFGGASVPGSRAIGADFVLAVRPDVVAHVNGGPTAPPPDDIEAVLEGCDAAIEIVQAGNTRALVETVRRVVAADALSRLQVGSDTPSGTGVIPLAVLRVLAYCASLADLAPELAVACATGSTARRYSLAAGTLEPGRDADLVVLDAPIGSVADDALGALRNR